MSEHVSQHTKRTSANVHNTKLVKTTESDPPKYMIESCSRVIIIRDGSLIGLRRATSHTFAHANPKAMLSNTRIGVQYTRALIPSRLAGMHPGVDGNLIAVALCREFAPPISDS